uniref:N-formylglutamate amidohydrolase n=1 Tax=Altererythrobacter sp. TaxID=1872480 RepID=UPI003D0C5720
DEDRPPLVVLGDRFGASCDASLISAGMRFLGAQGLPSAHNRPYSGGYVLDQHAVPARGLHALQIEVCRSSYLDSQMVEPGGGMHSMSRLIAGLVRELGAATARLAQHAGFAQAAE